MIYVVLTLVIGTVVIGLCIVFVFGSKILPLKKLVRIFKYYFFITKLLILQRNLAKS